GKRTSSGNSSPGGTSWRHSPAGPTLNSRSAASASTASRDNIHPSVSTLDRLSKAAVAISILLIVALQMALHPDLTWLLRALTSFALIFGWLSGRMAGQRSHTMWLIIAPLAPAVLLGVAGREGPVVELVWIAGLT